MTGEVAMQGILGCAGMFAAAGFLLGLLITLFTPVRSFSERLLMALVCSAMTVIAALLLIARDIFERSSAMRNVRAALLQRHDLDFTDYCRGLPDAAPTVLQPMREAIGKSFNVPPEKLRPDDSLSDDYRAESFSPFVYFGVINQVLKSLDAVPRRYIVNPNELPDVRSLAAKIQQIIDAESSAT